MRTYILTLITLTLFSISNAQETEVIPYQDSRVITTAVPFLLIASDARAAAMGDIGVATSADAYSQHWNPSKYAFSLSKAGLGVSYTPYLSKLVNDIFLGNITYFNRIDERSAFAASLKYFSLGQIEIVQDEFSEALIEKPNELTLDASYALRLADQFSMAVALRYLRSDLKIQAVDVNARAASSIGVDVTGYYQGEEEAYNDFNGRWRAGFAIQNIGPKIKYDDAGRENFIPTTLRLGGGFDFIFDQYNKLKLTAEVTKLLVPTPPKLGTLVEYNESGDNPGYQEGEDELISKTENYIIDGKSQDVGFVKGIFQSFSDAPGGFSEELKEFTWALGAEYQYEDSFAFRAGYFNESDEKGARKFFALGAGFKYTTVNIDLSYLFSSSKIQSPLENTLRFSLTFNFGDGTYDEY
ncbi:MAG TPA: type IX secretion system outer membrane channel protein PorV [Flavobacteriaceae bacterium]|nr:type IX secretion system outer membrane channel protein PorV [Flavobacteriaceae bacterium]